MGWKHYILPRFELYDCKLNRVHALPEKMVMGRHQNEFKDDDLMAREHCVLEITLAGLVITGLSANNPVRVNGKVIPVNRACRLRVFDIVAVGSHYFVVSNGKVSRYELITMAGSTWNHRRQVQENTGRTKRPVPSPEIKSDHKAKTLKMLGGCIVVLAFLLTNGPIYFF